MFKGITFVISSEEPNKQNLRKIIEKYKGKTQKTITKKVQYFIQSWNVKYFC